MLWASLGILIYIRVASGITGGFWPSGVLLAMASYPPLIVLMAPCRGQAFRHVLLAAVVLLYLLPFPIVGFEWDWMPWTVAAAVLCVLPARWAWPLFVMVVGTAGVVAALLGYGAYWAIWYMIVTADDGLIVFSVAALVGTVERLAGAREELARLALLRERLRLDGELRDVLGGRLQAIAFRMRKAARQDAADARHELDAATELARETMAEVRATAGAYRGGPVPGYPAQVESPALARHVLLAVLVIQCVLATTNLHFIERVNPLTLALGVLGLTAIVVLQMMPRTRVTFVAQSALILLPLAVLPGSWDRVLSFFSGSVLLRMRPPRSWLIVGVTLAGHLAVLLAYTNDNVANALASFGGHVMLMWLVYSLGRLTELATVLERTRHDLAEDAVRRERTRIARDLHDVLGYSLSAVALKGEVAGRLLDTAPDRARTELASLIAMVEQTMAELHSIVGGRVRLTLTTEIDAARQILRSAGIETTTHVRIPALPDEVDTALATVLRETVTNVLRHSQAGTCAITVSQDSGTVRLQVVNDGAKPPAAPSEPERPKTGLRNLAQRTGGRLTAGHRPGDLFEVVAEFRSDPARLARDPDGVHPVPSAQLDDG
ncbi:sensor histidine kinase [Actinomadura miaoliensis]